MAISRPVLSSRGIDAALKQVQTIAPALRPGFWAQYRWLRRMARTGSLAQAVPEAAKRLAEQVRKRSSYGQTVLALRLASEYTRQSLSLKGARVRSQRLLLQEAFLLLHAQLRIELGLKAPDNQVLWSSGVRSSEEPVWRATCDGSFREDSGAAGVLVEDPKGRVRAEVSFRLAAKDSVDAELQACRAALQTLRMFSARHADILVDAQVVVHAMREKLPLHWSLQEAYLAQEASQFQSIRVLRVSRLETAAADNLARLSNTAGDTGSLK